jgi:Flp pilus assembly protein TadD
MHESGPAFDSTKSEIGPAVIVPHRRRRLATCAVLAVAAVVTAGCQNSTLLNSMTSKSTMLSPTPASDAAKSEVDSRREAESWGAKYRSDPGDPDIALAYAQALRASGQRTQATSVLEQASMQQPRNTALLGAYGRALADIGHLEQALDVLGRAHSPDQPDWRILSAQGAVLDQLGRHGEAQRYYSSALKIRPDDPAVLSNLGLSYALAKDLKNAEATLRRAVDLPGANPKVRQNLALVVGLRGRFAEAETIARADLPFEQAADNVAYLREMLAQQEDLKAKLARPAPPARRTVNASAT